MAERFSSFGDMGNSLEIKGKPAPQQRTYQGTTTSAPLQTKSKPDFMEEDSDYVDIAERHIKSLLFVDKYGKSGFGELTTSKIRNILSLVNEIYNDVVLLKNNELPTEMKDRIRHLKVRLAYEAGREPIVKSFVTKTALIEGIDEIKEEKVKFIRFAKYLEALVAYHRFHGGRNE